MSCLNTHHWSARKSCGNKPTLARHGVFWLILYSFCGSVSNCLHPWNHMWGNRSSTWLLCVLPQAVHPWALSLMFLSRNKLPSLNQHQSLNCANTHCKYQVATSLTRFACWLPKTVDSETKNLGHNFKSLTAVPELDRTRRTWPAMIQEVDEMCKDVDSQEHKVNTTAP